jgi:hypothetical protein
MQCRALKMLRSKPMRIQRESYSSRSITLLFIVFDLDKTAYVYHVGKIAPC